MHRQQRWGRSARGNLEPTPGVTYWVVRTVKCGRRAIRGNKKLTTPVPDDLTLDKKDRPELLLRTRHQMALAALPHTSSRLRRCAS